MRYLLVAGVGAVVGAVSGGMLHLAGVRAEAGHRVGLTIVAGLAGCSVGVLPTLGVAAAAADLPVGLSPLFLYAISGAVAYGLAVAAVYLALHTVSDPAIRSTTRATAVVLPVGALLATAAGMCSAWALGFSTVTSSWVVVITLVILILSATFAVARVNGQRQTRRN